MNLSRGKTGKINWHQYTLAERPGMKSLWHKIMKSIDHKGWLWVIIFALLVCFGYYGFGKHSAIVVFDGIDSHIIRKFTDGREFAANGFTKWYHLEVCGTDKTVNDISYTFSSHILLGFFQNQLGYILTIISQCFLLGLGAYCLAKKTIKCNNFAAIGAAIVAIGYFAIKDQKIGNFYYNCSIGLLPFVILLLRHIANKPRVSCRDITILISFGFVYGVLNSLYVSIPFACLVCILYFLIVGKLSIRLIWLGALFWGVSVLPHVNDLIILAKLGPLSHRTAWDIDKLVKYVINVNMPVSMYIIIAVIIGGFLIKKITSEQMRLFSLFVICNKVIPILAIWHARLSAQYDLPNANMARVKWFCCIWIGLLFASFLRTLARQHKDQKASNLTTLITIAMMICVPLASTWRMMNNTWLYDSYDHYVTFAPDDIIRQHHNSDEPFRTANISSEPPYCYMMGITGIETISGYMNCYSLRFYYYWRTMTRALEDSSSLYYEILPASGRRLRLTYNPDGDTKNPADHFDPELVSLANAKYIWSQKPLEYPAYELIYSNPEPEIAANGLRYWLDIAKDDPGQGYGYVYYNKEYLPRAFIVGEFETCENLEEVYDKLAARSIEEIKAKVLIEREYAAKLPEALGGTGTCKITKYSPDNIIIKTSTDKPALLVVSNNHNPFWKCTIDGQRGELLCGYGTFWTVAIPTGEHEVEFVYSYSP